MKRILFKVKTPSEVKTSSKVKTSSTVKILSAAALSLLGALMLFYALFTPLPVYATGNDDDSSIAITVVIPRPEINNRPAVPAPVETFHVYPVHVWESRGEGRREIIRVYELRDDENPAHIPREPFERDGFRFELAEIVRREMPMHSVREHTETITLSTQTNDLETILRLLAQNIDYMDSEGYFGVLALDIQSIRIESQGTTSSSRTATRTREFPGQVSNDTALIPRTITENGRTYNLQSVEWQTQSATAIDHTQVATRFTAVATYSRLATTTTNIGYTTTAEYRGQISRISVGRTEFTAQFLGIPIASPQGVGVSVVQGQQVTITESQQNANGESGSASAGDVSGTEHESEPESEQEPLSVAESATPSLPAVIENVTVEQVHIGGIVIEAEQITQPAPVNETVQNEPVTANAEQDTQNKQEDETATGLSTGVIILLCVLGMVLTFFIGLKGKALLKDMKKAACFLLILGLAFGFSQSVYAVELPRYSFGGQNRDNAVHLDTRVQGQGSSGNGGSGNGGNNSVGSGNAGNASHSLNPNPNFIQNLNQNFDLGANGQVIHFDPRVTGHAPRASPLMASALNDSHGYSYGEVIGTLTVHRFNRTINVIAGATLEAMDFGAGHFSFTGLNQGNTGLIGHNRGHTNGFFSFVRSLQEGDIITLEAGGVTQNYSIAMLYTISETDFEPLMQFNDTRLTLITCVEYVPGQRRVAVGFALD